MEDILHQLTSKNLVSLCDLGFLQVRPVPFATIACWKPINPAHQQVMAPRQTCDSDTRETDYQKQRQTKNAKTT